MHTIFKRLNVAKNNLIRLTSAVSCMKLFKKIEEDCYSHELKKGSYSYEREPQN